MTTHRDASVMSKGEGTSRAKGKGIDPREWGNLNISQEELDIEAQAAALKSLTCEHKDKKKQAKKRTNARRAGHGVHLSPALRLPAESRPVAQIPQDSYLGMALRNVGRDDTRKLPSDDGDGSYPSSESSSIGSDFSGTSWDDEASLTSRDRHRRDNHHGRNR